MSDRDEMVELRRSAEANDGLGRIACINLLDALDEAMARAEWWENTYRAYFSGAHVRKESYAAGLEAGRAEALRVVRRCLADEYPYPVDEAERTLKEKTDADRT